MAHRVTFIPGDGSGPELTEATRRVLEATGVAFDWDVQEAGIDEFERSGHPLPEVTLQSLKTNKVGIKGPTTTPVGSGFRSINVLLRKELDLYACIRPCKAYEGVRTSRFPETDLVIFRENTEDVYAGIEFEKDSPEFGELSALIERVHGAPLREHSGVSIKPISAFCSERIVRAAFDLARQRAAEHGPNGPAPRVTIVHKANVLRVSDGLFREAALHIAEQYPDVAHDELLVDNAALQLVQKPQRFDVIVTTNLFGDILSDIASYWGGGLALATSANIGAQQALFEPVHGSAPDIAGRGIANPLAAIGCAALLLDYLAQSANATPELQTACRSWAARIQSAINHVLGSDLRTPDLGGNATTEEMTNAVIQLIKTA